ncbi:MAG TPA: FAD-dependent oxidoreductase [Firmicutes bacterium]|nr:FAD-dependent oxidoreductase [Bacillota bacterium]
MAADQREAPSCEPVAQRYDIIVIGGGPGGYAAAIRAAELGARVAVVERATLGGTCLNAGCIPTKALLRSAEVLETVRQAERFGIVVPEPPGVAWEKVQARRAEVVKTLVEGLTRLVRGHGIEVIRGEARLLPPPPGSTAGEAPVVEVSPAGTPAAPGTAVPVAQGAAAGPQAGGRPLRLVAGDVVLAMGSLPARLPVTGLEGPGVIGSDEALVLDRPPGRLAIIGGGVIGVEFASIYRSFGSEVVILEMLPSLLPVADAEISRRLALAFKRRGIEVYTGARLTEVIRMDEGPAGGAGNGAGGRPGGGAGSTAGGREGNMAGGGTGSGVAAGDGDGGRRAAGRFLLRFERGGKEEQTTADTILVAVGRRPNVTGLEGTGVEFDRGGVKVDPQQRTSRPHVYAVGDLTGGTMLAHAAFMQGIIAAEAALGRAAHWHHVVPAAVFSSPEVAWVGATEEELRAEGREYRVAKLPFAAVGKAQVLGETDGMVKLLAEPGTGGRILGVHLLGPAATELVHEFTLAMQQGLTVEQLAGTIHAHPTLSEAVAEAAHLFLGTPVHAAPVRPAPV